MATATTDTFTVTVKMSIAEANATIEALQLLSGFQAFNSKAKAATPQERQQATADYRATEVLLAKFGAKPKPEHQRMFAEAVAR